MTKLKEHITLAVGIVSLAGMIAAWATIPHRVAILEKRADDLERNQGSIQVIEERTKIMLQDLIYLRKRIDDIVGHKR